MQIGIRRAQRTKSGLQTHPLNFIELERLAQEQRSNFSGLNSLSQHYAALDFILVIFSGLGIAFSDSMPAPSRFKMSRVDSDMAVEIGK